MASSGRIGFVAALAVGTLGGWVLARMTADGRAPEAAADSRTATRLVPETPQASELSAPERLPSAEEDTVSDRIAPTEALPLFHSGLQRYGRTGIRQGWSSMRGHTIPETILAEGMDDYEDIVLESPEAIGRRLGRRENERDAAREDAATGGVFAVLSALEQGEAGPLTEHTTSADAFEKFFARQAPEQVENGVEHLERMHEALKDGTTLQFPAGVFRVDYPHLPSRDIPRDVTIAGAGMEATLLLVDEFFAGERLRNLTLRDCTILSRNYLFDIRGAFSSIRLEGVRITGFDKGSGSSCVFGTDGTAIYARDSRFEGGYGRSPRSGQLFRVDTDALLARFEGCTFDTIRLGVDRIRPGASVVFSNCRMSDIIDRVQPEETDHRGVLFPGTVADLYDWSRGEPPSKDLNDLFPNWEERVNQ